MVNLITRLRRNLFGLNLREKRAAAVMAHVLSTMELTAYKRVPSPDDFNFDRDVIWGTKTIDPEQATRIIG